MTFTLQCLPFFWGMDGAKTLGFEKVLEEIWLSKSSTSPNAASPSHAPKALMPTWTKPVRSHGRRAPRRTRAVPLQRWFFQHPQPWDMRWKRNCIRNCRLASKHMEKMSFHMTFTYFAGCVVLQTWQWSRSDLVKAVTWPPAREWKGHLEEIANW